MIDRSEPSASDARLPRGVFVLSIDLELAWGSFDHGGYERDPKRFDRVRPIVGALLEMLERHRIAATFAVVGHLFLDHCVRENGVAHPEVVRARHRWYPQDWFSRDPCSNLAAAPHWYGRDLVEQIGADPLGHEIASHSFSHVIFDDAGCSAAVAHSELDRCVALAREVTGRELRSFVFPRNRVGHLEVLAGHGFRVYRGLDPTWFEKLPVRLLRRAGRFADDLLAITPPVGPPQWVEPPGIWNIAGSMLYPSRRGLRRLIPVAARVHKAKKGIDAAVARQGVFQLWLHPFSLADDEQPLLDGLEQILAYTAAQRDEGALDVLTLGELAERCDATQTGSANRRGIEAEPAIAVHDREAELFQQRYRQLVARPYRSAFTYGRKQVDEIVADWLGPAAGRRLLDVGCGTGFHLQRWQEGGFRCVGVDGAWRMLAAGRERGTPLAQADVERLPFADGCFDVVVSIEVLRYMQDAPGYVRELRRVLRPGGTCIVTAAPRWSLHGFALVHAVSRALRLGRYGRLRQRFDTVGSLRRLFEESGFEEIEVAGCFVGPFVLLEKLSPGLTEWSLRRWERLDRRLSSWRVLQNVCNHLLVRCRREAALPAPTLCGTILESPSHEANP